MKTGVRRLRTTVAAVAVAGMMFVACGGSAGTSSEDAGGAMAEGAGGTEVLLENIKFEPAEITVSVGEAVTWSNEDTVLHTVTSGVGQEQGAPGVSENTEANPDGLFDHEMPEGETFSFTFEEAGTVEYFCAIHPGMTGTVVVE